MSPVPWRAQVVGPAAGQEAEDLEVGLPWVVQASRCNVGKMFTLKLQLEPLSQAHPRTPLHKVDITVVRGFALGPECNAAVQDALSACRHTVMDVDVQDAGRAPIWLAACDPGAASRRVAQYTHAAVQHAAWAMAQPSSAAHRRGLLLCVLKAGSCEEAEVGTWDELVDLPSHVALGVVVVGGEGTLDIATCIPRTLTATLVYRKGMLRIAETAEAVVAAVRSMVDDVCASTTVTIEVHGPPAANVMCAQLEALRRSEHSALFEALAVKVGAETHVTFSASGVGSLSEVQVTVRDSCVALRDAYVPPVLPREELVPEDVADDVQRKDRLRLMAVVAVAAFSKVHCRPCTLYGMVAVSKLHIELQRRREDTEAVAACLSLVGQSPAAVLAHARSMKDLVFRALGLPSGLALLHLLAWV